MNCLFTKSNGTTRRLRLQAIWIIIGIGPASWLDAQRFQAPFGIDDTWNVYEYVAESATWRGAVDEAAERALDGTPGRLVDVVSARENAFVELISGHVPVWIGLTDREGSAPPSISGGLSAPQESARLPNPETQGWAWTSGAAFEYENWAVSEPLDFRGGEDAAFMTSNGRWDDMRSGLGTDEPIAPVLQPGTSIDETGPALFSFVIEYPVESPFPLDGIPIPSIPPKMPEHLPARAGGTGGLRVTDYRGDFTVGARIEEVAETLDMIANGSLTATITSANYAIADFADPESRSTGGPFVKEPPASFPSDVVGSIDRNFVSTATGSLYVPVDGLYTIQVRSSAGFGLQIGDASFKSVSGNGQIDAIDPSTIYHGTQTDDADTRGVIALTQGEHDFRFVHWAIQSGSYWEITTAQGDHVHDMEAQWLALGDGRTLPERTETPVVSLVGSATVVNAKSDQAGRGSLDLARETLAIAKEEGSAWKRTDVTTVVLRDDDGICCRRPGRMLDDNLIFTWPLNDPDVGGEDTFMDHFASEILGQLTVNDGDEIPGETLPITFGMFASDGVQLRIHGASFVEASDPNALNQVEDGDTLLTFPYATSNSNLFGRVELIEGQLYDFQAIHFENQGDAGFELWTALGQHLDGIEGKPFFPLGNVLDQRILPANAGLTFANSSIAGDYNRNGHLDLGDLELQIAGIQSADLSFDLNQDLEIDFADLKMWIHDLRSTWIGDANLDGLFDSQDLVIVLVAGKYETGAAALWSEGDWDADGTFSTSDLVVALQDGGYETGPSVAAANPVPERLGSPLWPIAMMIAVATIRRETSGLTGQRPE